MNKAELYAENERLRKQLAQSERKRRRLVWALRAIDCRLHDEVECRTTDRAGKYVMVSEHTLRQMCRVAVGVSAERAE